MKIHPRIVSVLAFGLLVSACETIYEPDYPNNMSELVRTILEADDISQPRRFSFEGRDINNDVRRFERIASPQDTQILIQKLSDIIQTGDDFRQSRAAIALHALGPKALSTAPLLTEKVRLETCKFRASGKPGPYFTDLVVSYMDALLMVAGRKRLEAVMGDIQCNGPEVLPLP
jgi:hypothetical protein